MTRLQAGLEFEVAEHEATRSLLRIWRTRCEESEGIVGAVRDLLAMREAGRISEERMMAQIRELVRG